MWQKALVIALVPYSLWLVFAYQYHFIDGANLLFHEGGHVVFGFMGETLHFLGGTVGQLFFPAACAIYFWREDKRFESLVCAFWLGESLMYMAEYMSDAKDRVLPLVGGGIHDWHWLFSEWGVLNACRGIGGFFHLLASVLVLGCLWLLARQAWSAPEINNKHY
ncbi:MAG TPA: hypothetical protein VIM96_07225 [Pseudomonadales bacterium]|jgi:hypothetical protein